MEYARMLGLPVLLHCENAALTDSGAMNEGYTASVMGIRGLPREAYEMDVARNALLSLLTGCHLHVLHVSTAREVEIVRFFKAQGANLSAETAPHYWCLTDEACRGYDTNAKMNPPLRTQADCEAMIAGLQDGTLDCIATDHAPHARYEKEAEFGLAPFGIVGLETSLGAGRDPPRAAGPPEFVRSGAAHERRAGPHFIAARAAGSRRARPPTLPCSTRKRDGRSSRTASFPRGATRLLAGRNCSAARHSHSWTARWYTKDEGYSRACRRGCVRGDRVRRARPHAR
jgi:hypothetical protein